MQRHVAAPNLVVEAVVATPNGVRVSVANRGYAPTGDSFWVEVYVDPDPAPTAVNQIWRDVADEGLVWGVEATLEVDQVLVLTVGDAFYRAAYSDVDWPLALGTPVYAQADSVNLGTTYGAVLETHEVIGEPYADNILGATVVAAGPGTAVPEMNDPLSPPGGGSLPPRP